MIKRVDRYVGRAAMLGTLVVWLSLTLLLVLFSLMGELRDTQGGYGVADAFWFAFLTSPRVAYSIFPIAALLGTLVGVGGLAEGNELVAFRTSGVSRLRLAGAAMGGVLLLAIPVMAMGEWLAPAAEQQARAYRLAQMVGQVIIGGPRGMWLRDGSQIVNIQLPLLEADRDQQSVRFRNVVIYTFGDDSSLQKVTRARRANHDGEQWRLFNVESTRFAGESAIRENEARSVWASQFQPDLLDSAVSRPQYLSMKSLVRYVKYLGQNGLDDYVYRTALWDKMLFPFVVLALVMAGMPFVFGMARNQNLGVRLFTGMMLGGLAMILMRTAENMGEAYALSPLLSIGLTPLFLLAASLWALKRTV